MEKRSKKDFIFTVKAHRDISHTHKFELKREVVEKFDKIVEICKVLRAKLLVSQIPYKQKPTSSFLRNLENFLDYAGNYGLDLGVEARGPNWRNKRGRAVLKSILSRFEVTHVFDASYEGF